MIISFLKVKAHRKQPQQTPSQPHSVTLYAGSMYTLGVQKISRQGMVMQVQAIDPRLLLNSTTQPGNEARVYQGGGDSWLPLDLRDIVSRVDGEQGMV